VNFISSETVAKNQDFIKFNHFRLSEMILSRMAG